MNSGDRLNEITRSTIEKGIVSLAVLAVPIALTSVYRALHGGWLPLYGVQITLLAAIALVAALRRRLSVELTGSLSVTICAAAAVFGLVQFGWVAPAGHWFAAIAAFLAGMLYERKGRLAFLGLTCLVYALVGALYLLRIITPAVPAENFVALPSSWIIELLCAVLFLLLVLPTVKACSESIGELIRIESRLRNQIRHLAEHDHLTNLPIQWVGMDRLERACLKAEQAGGRAAVLFVDLDRFKPVNDRHGHEAGDACLVEIAQRLKRRLRGEDTVCRIGGDEFLIVLDEVSDRASAEALAQHLVGLIEQQIMFEGQPLELSASIGIALYPEHGRSPEDLRRAADMAMYRAKRSAGMQVAVADAGELPDGESSSAARRETPAKDHSKRKAESHVLREVVVHRSLALIAGVLAVAVLVGMWRMRVHAVHPNFMMLSLAAAITTLAYALRRRIPIHVLSVLVAGIGLLIALPGLYRLGLAAPGAGWSLATSLFLIALLFDRRIYLTVAILAPTGIAAFGYGHSSGLLHAVIDVGRDFSHAASWAIYLVGLIGCVGLVLLAWGSFKQSSRSLLREIDAERRELERAALIDPLTGLPRSRLAMERLELTCERAKRSGTGAALMYLDLDGFKGINDTLGHDAGDHCLREVATRMQAELLPVDTPARVGGDEFLIIVDHARDASGVAQLAGRVIASVARPMRFRDREFGISASIGIALFPMHGRVWKELKQQADLAMYEAKRAGKNRYAIAPVGEGC